MKKLFIIAALFMLASCKTHVSSTLFTSDIIAATNDEKTTAPLVFTMKTNSSDCVKGAEELVSAVKRQMPDVEFIGCEDIEFEEFARFRVQAEILAFNNVPPVPSQAFGIGVTEFANEYFVYYLKNPEVLRAVWDSLPEDLTMFQVYELEPVLKAVLNNDLRKTVTVTTDNVFADGTPVQGTATRELPRRDQIELVLSDVTNTAFGTVDNASLIARFAVSE